MHAAQIAVTIAEFSTGGSERVAIRLANRWARAGRAVTIFCGDEEGPTRGLVADEVAVRPILPRARRNGDGDGEHRAASPRALAALGRALADQIGGRRFDAVVGPGNYHVPLLDGLARALPRERPAIVCKISNPLVRADRSPLRQALFLAHFRRATRRFDQLVAMAPGLQAEARALLRRTTVAWAAEPSLDEGRIAPARDKASGLILCVGRLAPQKNFALALETFARLAPGYRLAMLGEGEDYPALQAQAEALGIADRVHFAGFVADVGAWLASADALLSTSRFEGYPAALVEALAARVPVVTTPCSFALPDIMIDPSFGAVAAADPAALGAALDRVLAERRRPATAPLEILARRHHDVHAAEAWLKILDQAVADRAAAARARPALQPIAAGAPVAGAAIA